MIEWLEDNGRYLFAVLVSLVFFSLILLLVFFQSSVVQKEGTKESDKEDEGQS
jgi:type II secretory pathway component PulJ